MGLLEDLDAKVSEFIKKNPSFKQTCQASAKQACQVCGISLLPRGAFLMHPLFNTLVFAMVYIRPATARPGDAP